MGKAENFVEGYLHTQAKKRNFICYKFLSGNDGVPDRVLIGNGYTVFIETKAPGRTTRVLQKAVIRQMRTAGANVFVIDSRQDVDRLLDYIKQHPIKQGLTRNMPQIGIE